MTNKSSLWRQAVLFGFQCFYSDAFFSVRNVLVGSPPSHLDYSRSPRWPRHLRLSSLRPTVPLAAQLALPNTAVPPCYTPARDLTPPPSSGETQLSSWLCSQHSLPARAPLSSHVGLPGTPPVILPWRVLFPLLDPLCPLVFQEMSCPLLRLRGHRHGEAVLAASAVLPCAH